jgi:hypothetical protein
VDSVVNVPDHWIGTLKIAAKAFFCCQREAPHRMLGAASMRTAGAYGHADFSMELIQFQTTIGDDGIIRPPLGVSLPTGEAEVTIVPKPPGLAGQTSQSASVRDLIERLARAAKELQVSVDDLPADLARHHDHYLHGLPKGVDEP